MVPKYDDGTAFTTAELQRLHRAYVIAALTAAGPFQLGRRERVKLYFEGWTDGQIAEAVVDAVQMRLVDLDRRFSGVVLQRVVKQ